MTPIRIVLCLLALAAFQLPEIAVAQANPSPEEEEPFDALVPFIAMNSHGDTGAEITSLQISILDNKKSLQLGKLYSARDMPLQLGLMIDTSNSQRYHELYVQSVKATSAFVHQLLVNPDDRVFIVSFDTRVQGSGWMKKDEVERFKVNITPGGATALHDAVYFACREYMMKSRVEPKRRVLVVLSDGEDNQSRVSRTDAIAAALASGTIVFTISTSGQPPPSYSIRTPFYEPSGKNVLGLLASDTGGDAFTPNSSKGVSEALENIAVRIGRMYSVTFRSDNSARPGAFRPLEVKIATDKKMKIEAPKGYYVPNVASGQ